MSNLSNELCEICGIKGKWFEYTTETTDGCVNLGKKRVFPDFTQPENFVKLFGLPVKIDSNEPTETIIHILSGCFFHIFDVEDFIGALYTYITGYNRYSAQIIQAIREEEWKYE